MLQIDDIKIEFSNMGYFNGSIGWLHSKRTINTYELIFVTDGEVYLQEGERKFILRRGDMLRLNPNVMHLGYKKSLSAPPAFFWAHLFGEGIERLSQQCFKTSDFNKAVLFFKELNHLAAAHADNALIECKIAEFLLSERSAATRKSKLFSDVAEYIRVHIAKGLTVKQIAAHFSYSSDYLSKLFVKNTGLSLKKYLDRERNAYIKSLLLTTNLSLKEIAEIAGFDCDGELIKYFTYHNRTGPKAFKNSNYATHTNAQ